MDKLPSNGSHSEKILIFFSSTQGCQKIYNEFLTDLCRDAYNADDSSLMIEMFHAKHKTETKETILTLLKKVDSPISILFSTIAFGMGVQIPDIDIGIHCGLPKNILSYCQEKRRCVRDHGRVELLSYTPSGLVPVNARMMR